MSSKENKGSKRRKRMIVRRKKKSKELQVSATASLAVSASAPLGKAAREQSNSPTGWPANGRPDSIGKVVVIFLKKINLIILFYFYFINLLFYFYLIFIFFIFFILCFIFLNCF